MTGGADYWDCRISAWTWHGIEGFIESIYVTTAMDALPLVLLRMSSMLSDVK